MIINFPAVFTLSDFFHFRHIPRFHYYRVKMPVTSLWGFRMTGNVRMTRMDPHVRYL
jgi:hypothetical protein